MSYFKTIWGLISDSVARAVRIDSATHAMEVIDYAHHEVHGGSHFTYSQTDADFDIADTVELLIVTPDTAAWAHMIIDVVAALDTTVSLYEGATHTVNAAQLVYNNDRNSATANTTTINTHNDDGADGTLIFQSVFGISAGGGANRVTGGGTSRSEQEWILDQDESYLLVVSTGTDDSTLSIKLSWYEHTNKG